MANDPYEMSDYDHAENYERMMEAEVAHLREEMADLRTQRNLLFDAYTKHDAEVGGCEGIRYYELTVEEELVYNEVAKERGLDPYYRIKDA